MKPTLEMMRVVVPFLASTGLPLSGYDIIKRTSIGRGACYNILHRLRGAGWLVSRQEPYNPRQGRTQRTMYWITPAGKANATAILDLLKVST